jgi:type IV fimbrial biogenesis protein FimT
MLQGQRISRGFSLLQTLIVVAIAGILVAMALPSFTDIIRSNRLATATNDLLASLNLARSESIKRGKDVVVRKTGLNWEDGWEVFVDVSRSSASTTNIFNDDGDSTPCESGEDCRLKIYTSLPPSISLRGRNNVSDFIRYTSTGISNYVPDGLNSVVNDYFVICDKTHNSSVSSPGPDTVRVVVLNTVGNPKLAVDTDTTKDGIPNLSTGVNVQSCLL